MLLYGNAERANIKFRFFDVKSWRYSIERLVTDSAAVFVQLEEIEVDHEHDGQMILIEIWLQIYLSYINTMFS